MSSGQDEGWVRQRLERWRSRRDGEALGELLKWQRDRAYAIARRVLGDGADAEDAVQQAFTKLLSRTEGFGNPADFRLAVYRAVVQCALDMARANRVRSRLEKAMSQIEKSAPQLPDHAAEQAEAVRLVFQELERMPEEERALVVLCYQEGISVSDAAELLAVPRETLRDRLAGSMAELRKRVSGRGVALSLLLLTGLLQQGAAQAAPASLCEALDLTLPGAPCAEIPAAAAVATAPAALVAGAQASTRAPPLKLTLAGAAGLVLVLGAWTAWHSGPSREAGPRVVVGKVVQETGPAVRPRRAPLATAAAPTAAPDAQAGQGQPAARTEQLEAEDATPKTGVAQKARRNAKSALDNVPAGIRAAATQAIKGVVLIKVKQEIEDGAVVYEFKGKAGDKEYEIKVSAEGKVLEAQEENNDNDERNENDDKGKAHEAVKPPEAPRGDF